MYNINLKTAHFPAQSDAEIRDITIGDLLREIAAKYPDAIAVQEIDDNGQNARTYTYVALLQESEQLALALSTRFQHGEKIVVWAPNQPEWILMEYACALAGLVLVTANPSFQAKELRYVLEQSGAVALFYVQEFRGNPMATIAQEALIGNDNIREQALLTDQAAMLHQANPKQATTLPKVSPEDAAQIQYTSGTTGFPKGATLSHCNLHNNARLFADRAGVNQQSVWANFMPLFPTAGCATGTLGCLQAGCRMLLIRQFNADILAELIEREGVTTFFAVPTMLVALLESLAKTPRDMASMHSITSGGAPVAPDLVRNVKAQLGCHFQSAFGQTESSPMISLNHHDVSLDEICTSAGQPLPQCEVSIRSPESKNAVNAEIATALHDAFVAFDQDDSASVAVFWGEGGAFCAGWDLKAAAALSGDNPMQQYAYPDDPTAAVPHAAMGPSRLQLSKPVIAAIAGPAVAGGMELALWCDLRVMEETAYMGVYCRRFGVPLIDGGTVRLPRLIGQGRAMDLILTGRKVEADEALRIGLCEYLAPEGEARQKAEEIAQALCQFPQQCMRSDRQPLLAQWELSEAEALRQEWQMSAGMVVEEGVAGAGRFAADRKPPHTIT